MIIVIGIFAFFQFFSLYRVIGDSMSPTLQDGQIVIVNNDRDVERGDLIVFNYQGVDYMKRVIALPGEQVEIKNHTVFVNQRPLPEPYIRKQEHTDLAPITVQPGTLFVLGDDRVESFDSRDMGLIPFNQIKGTIVYY